MELDMRLIPTGHTLSLFLALMFSICIGWGLVTPVRLHMHSVWELLLPGFEFISIPAFAVGLVEVYVYGWFAALIIVPLYNFFDRSETA